MKHLRIALGMGSLIGITALQPIFAEGLARAETTPPPSATKFSHQGHVDAISAKEGRLVVNRNSYQISANARVYGPTGGLIPLDGVRKGIFIAFNTSAQGNSVSEIWIIPVD